MRHVLTDHETEKDAAITFPATAVAAVAAVATCAAAVCAAAVCAAASCAAFVAQVSIGARSGSVIGLYDPISARSTPELPRRISTAVRAAARCACARQASDG